MDVDQHLKVGTIAIVVPNLLKYYNPPVSAARGL